MRFLLSHTHAYPGCRVKIDEEANTVEEFAEFSDGVIVPCRHEVENSQIVLTIMPYRTSRGTEIAEKNWILRPDRDSGGWKIKGRAP
jgi:hypothetical protein